MNVCMHVYVCIVYVACGDQKRALHPLLLELGIQPGSSRNPTWVFRKNHQCSLAPQPSLQAPVFVPVCFCLDFLPLESGVHYVA